MCNFKIKALVSKIDRTYAYLQGTREYSWESSDGKIFSVLENEKAPMLVENIKIEIEQSASFTSCLSDSFCHRISFLFCLNAKDSNECEDNKNIYVIESISMIGVD